MTLKNIIFAWDSAGALIIFVTSSVLLPNHIINELAKDLYLIGITVLSIVFALYFAALAIIVSSGDNLFIKFLEMDDHLYTEIINHFKFSLVWIFIALIYSIISYIVTSILLGKGCDSQSKWFMVIFNSLFAYGLLVSFFSIWDSMRYAKYRAKFLLIEKEDKESKS